MPLPALSDTDRQRIALIALSYERLSGRPLVTAGDDLVAALWTAPLAIVAHGTEADPIFFFGNEIALRLFEMDYSAFTRLPSRLSAEPVLREERSRLLERVARDGIIDDYAGVRISASGRRFRITRAAVWNLAGRDGSPAGQAAAFSTWEPLSP
jgi:MEKHLA domain